MSVTGALGSAIHGGYDLALALHPVPSMAAFPNPIDPRGLLNFGVAGLGVALLARLIVRGHRFLPRLGYLGYVAAILLLILYPTCAPYQHDADLGPGGDLMHDRLQGFHLGQIFGVQDLGSVEGYRRQRCVDVQQDWLLIHVASELLPRRGAQ